MFTKLFTLILYIFNIHPGERCRLNSKIDFTDVTPVVIKDGRMLEPTNGYGNVDFDYGDTITLSCVNHNIIHTNAINQVSTATISCAGGDNFKNDGWLNSPSRFIHFRCPYPPNTTNSQSRRTNRTCFEGNAVYEVGYQIQNEFYPSYESCFDEGTYNVIYSKYTQKAYNFNFKTKTGRPYFKTDNVFGSIPLDFLYSPRGQRAAIAQRVGRMIDVYITNKAQMSRGHLASKTDFVFPFGQRATFHYVNCAPQWKEFNGGNWNTLEVDLRQHIHNANYNTIIYTGTFGVTQLQNEFGRRVDIYLYTDENNNPVIPVPQYFYKVVYEPSTKKGIAFIGINNPYYTPAEARELFFCNDICRSNTAIQSWLTWNPDNPVEGYSFCCSVPDFSMTVNHLPYFRVNGLLT